jgi:class 3 adenylate cyclase
MTETSAVTILFTDLVGSTAMLDRLGDEAGDELMRRHFDILREAIAIHGGTEIKNLGDGLMVTFSNPAEGAACAVDMQRGIARHNGTFPHQTLSMRVGLNTGVAITDSGDYFGIPVVIAKRLCDCALGGQIVMSASVREMVDGYDGSCDDLGALPLRGLSEPVSAAALLWSMDEAAEIVTTSGEVVGDMNDFEVDTELLRITGLPWARVGERHLVLLTSDRSQVARRSRAPTGTRTRAEGARATTTAEPGLPPDRTRAAEPAMIAIRCHDSRSERRSGNQSA